MASALKPLEAHPPSPATTPHAGFIAASLVSGAIALFMLSASFTEVFVAINRAKFVPDEAVILSWDFAPARASTPRGRVVSSGEEILIDRYWIMDPEQAMELERAGKLEGHRTPVLYLPPTPPWSTIDNIVAFRIQTPEQFGLGFSPGLPVSNIALAVLSVVLFRRGLRRPAGTDGG